MRLAWCNIAHNGMRFTVTVLGTMCPVFLMVFQGSILLGFMRAASKIIDRPMPISGLTGEAFAASNSPCRLSAA